MMLYGFNYVDLFFVFLLIFQIGQGIRLGVWPLLARFGAFVSALIVSLAGYEILGKYISSRFEIFPSFAYGLAFIIIFVIVQMIVHVLLQSIFTFIPEPLRKGVLSKIFAIGPAFLDSLILIGLIVILVVTLPVPTRIRDDVLSSSIGNEMVNALPAVEEFVRKYTNGAIDEALTHFTIRPESDERIKIPHRPSELAIDESAEGMMLDLVNEERARVGAPPLVMDQTIVEVARAHSRDMWERGYFAHSNPDGEDPFHRMQEGGVEYRTAGENLALAPTVGIAHRGLMNSPGHKRNILDPSFRRVGIGVIDGGRYGKMFTQNFAN